jgi:UDP-N-acetylglucosamine--N-acetylmuramyl-(pentapeptide) pyrophosphoryl-undecaprenol N-acetylglucosamine transferase
MKIRPDVIVTYGGYLAVPVAIAGWLLRIPIVTHEQTILPGLANKIVARVADKIALTFPDSEMNYLKGGIDKRKIVITGNPIRKSIYYYGEVNKKMLPTLFVTCGNQGSHFVNELIFRNLNRLLSFCEIVHQTGKNSLIDDYTNSLKIREGLTEEFRKRYLPVVYVHEDEIGKVYAEASVVLSRGGVNTLIELVALNKRGIIIPGHAEQLANGQFLEKIGLGVCLHPHGLKDEDFIACVQYVIRRDDPKVAVEWRDLYESAEWKLAKVILEYSRKL